MDLEKINRLIEFVGQSNVTELSVTEKGTTVRIFRTQDQCAGAALTPQETGTASPVPSVGASPAQVVFAPLFGVLHRRPSPEEPPFVEVGDQVVEGQTLLIIEAMKVFNRITAPVAGRIVHLAGVDGAEVETGDVLVEIAE